MLAARLQNAARGFVSDRIYATLVVTLDRLFVSRHVKTWDNRVGDIENLSPAKNGRKSCGLHCISFFSFAQLSGYVFDMHSKIFSIARVAFSFNFSIKKKYISSACLRKIASSMLCNRVSSFYYANMFTSDFIKVRFYERTA